MFTIRFLMLFTRYQNQNKWKDSSIFSYYYYGSSKKSFPQKNVTSVILYFIFKTCFERNLLQQKLNLSFLYKGIPIEKEAVFKKHVWCIYICLLKNVVRNTCFYLSAEPNINFINNVLNK